MNERADHKSRLKPARQRILSPIDGAYWLSPLVRGRANSNPHHWLLGFNKPAYSVSLRARLAGLRQGFASIEYLIEYSMEAKIN